jgi:transcriptional regulator with GAF, ATPase, and Fis domain
MDGLVELGKRLHQFGKENLSDILHYTATGLKDFYKCKMVRVYMEDLYEGMLICHYMTGQNQLHDQQITQYISLQDSIISHAFNRNQVVASWNLPDGVSFTQNPLETGAKIKTSIVFPVVYQLRPIGTVSLDWEEEGSRLGAEQIDAIQTFLGNAGGVIDRAKSFHQKISFSKHLDLARKKEAAWRMVRSAVNLIDKLTLASVFVPSAMQNPKIKTATPQDMLEVLAVFSKNKEDAAIYSSKGEISVLQDRNLINRILKFDDHKGLVARQANPPSVYIKDIRAEEFQRKEATALLDLVSLYQIPLFNRHTGQFICAVNYYTNTPYEFTEAEKMLLHEHASMAEKLIREDSLAHIEIEVLSEIEELLSDQDTSLQNFLMKILDKTSELIGADSGTVSLYKIIDGKGWLVVEDESGKLIGAKSRGWKKSKIPPLRVGGHDLPDEVKSLTGFCAHSARPLLVNDVQNSLLTQGFYKPLSPQIKAELTVPIISGNNVLGVINQDSFRKNFFTEEHKNILLIIARLISQKVHNLRHIEELKQEMLHLRQDVEYRHPKVRSYFFGNVIGKSRNMHFLAGRINTVVQSICKQMLEWDGANKHEMMMGLPSLLITGETGTGKEFFFNNIFSLITEIFQKNRGAHFKLPLKKTNIAAYSGELTYSELFGHKKGAFTGAENNRQGIVEEANGGVVFLDEIGDADPKTQVQLLRFLDTGVFMRLGENHPQYARIFLVAATNKNLLEEIEKGRFREDLYHRLSALSFHLPTLNERLEDIEDLAIHFLGRLFNTYKKDRTDDSLPYITPDAIEFLRTHRYRGNVRELKNILLRATLFSKEPTITLNDLATSTETLGGIGQAIHTTPAPDANGGMENLLARLESGDGDFWSAIHRPFKDKHMTRDSLKQVFDLAQSRYQTNLPGLAVRLRACQADFRNDPQEWRKFISFRNFVYKTVRTAVHQ